MFALTSPSYDIMLLYDLQSSGMIPFHIAYCTVLVYSIRTVNVIPYCRRVQYHSNTYDIYIVLHIDIRYLWF